MLSQSASYAEYAIKRFDPDLIVIQDFVNQGRRPFLSRDFSVPDFDRESLENYFNRDPNLYIENIPLFHFENPRLVAIHNKLVVALASYRMIQILINHLAIHFQFQFPNHLTSCSGDIEKCRRIFKKFYEPGQKINHKSLANLVAKYPKMNFLLLDPIHSHYCGQDNPSFLGVPVLSICLKDKGPEYYVAHPPAYVFGGYAEQFVEYLQKHRNFDK